LDNRSPVIWTALSVGVSGVVLLVAGGGWLGIVLAQAALVLVVSLYRTFTER